MILFGLNNASVKYQRMMNKVFREEIGDTLEVYMDEMIVESSKEESHYQHLYMIFKRIQQYNMRLNLKKCTFEARVDKFVGFYLTDRGIKANLDKCEAVV